MLLLAVIGFAACNKDDDGGRFEFENEVEYFTAGQTREVRFVAVDVASCAVSGIPTGWGTPQVDLQRSVVKITAPAEGTEDAKTSGVISFTATTTGGKALSASVFAVIGESIDLSAEPANSYLLNRKNATYTIDVSRTGHGRGLDVERVEIIWQASSSLVRYITLDDGKLSFFVGTEDDASTLRDGNALLGGYDRAGNLVWSWHLWIADYDTESEGGTVTFNGYEMMTRNLGALASGNATDEEILDSFGMFYQWGRRTPFIGPRAHTSSNGSSADMYDAEGSSVSLEFKASDAQTGTAEYAENNPLLYITGVEESRYDWLWSAPEQLWGSVKSEHDPCPYGWRVAPAAAFAGLEIAEPPVGFDYTAYMDKYGWTLTDGVSQSLFMGAGRRVYTDGKFQNVYVNPDDERPTRNAALYDQPWVGLYWTSDVSGSDAQAFSFYFDKAYVENSAVEGIVNHRRANAMPVRCVRE